MGVVEATDHSQFFGLNPLCLVLLLLGTMFKFENRVFFCLCS